jgi:hypothetical protein
MSLSFPVSPSIGTVYNQFVWDGVAWQPNPQAMFVTSVDGAIGAVTLPGRRRLIASQLVAPGTPVAVINFFYDFTQNLFDQYELDAYDVQFSTTASWLQLRCSTDGSTFDTAANYRTISGIGNAGGTQTGWTGNNAATALSLGTDISGGGAPSLADYKIRFSMPGTTDRYKFFLVDEVGQSTQWVWRGVSGGAYVTTTFLPLKGLQLSPSSAINISRGVFNLWGIIPGPNRGS